MKDIYNFIEDMYAIEDNYFQFFYGKNLRNFINANIIDEGEFNLFIGEKEGAGIRGKEKEFEYIFSPILEKYKERKKTIGTNALIQQIENAMFTTDSIGRIALVRRISRRLNEILSIDVWGIDRISGIDYLEDDGSFGVLYWDVIFEGENGEFLFPDNLKGVYYCLTEIELAINDLCYFCNEIKTLCLDFSIKYQEELKRLGFDKLNRLTAIDFSHRKSSYVKNKSKVNYRNIFREPWKSHIAELERILETHGYIKEKQWIGENGKKNELAELYHYLKMEEIITQGEESRQLYSLYAEFDLKIGKDNTKNGEYCTIRTLRKASGDSETKERYERILSQWINRNFI